MADKILIGKNGNDHGIWVSKPGRTVQQGGQMLMSSVQDMLKIHAQGSITSYGYTQSNGLWGHDVDIPFPELPYIPLAFMGLKTSDAEPFQFPPDLFNLMVSQTFNGVLVNYITPAGIGHNRLKFRGFINPYECKFNYVVFLTKLRDKF